MQWVIETELERLNRLSEESDGPVFRLEERQSAKSGAFERFIWMNGRTSTTTLSSRESRRTLSGRGQCPEVERVDLMKLLDSRITVLHVVLSRLRDIHATATREMNVFRSGKPPASPWLERL
jgi:hypothetical protein